MAVLPPRQTSELSRKKDGRIRDGMDGNLLSWESVLKKQLAVYGYR